MRLKCWEVRRVRQYGTGRFSARKPHGERQGVNWAEAQKRGVGWEDSGKNGKFTC